MARELFAIFMVGFYAILAVVIFLHLILQRWRER